MRIIYYNLAYNKLINSNNENNQSNSSTVTNSSDYITRVHPETVRRERKEKISPREDNNHARKGETHNSITLLQVAYLDITTQPLLKNGIDFCIQPHAVTCI